MRGSIRKKAENRWELRVTAGGDWANYAATTANAYPT